MFERIVRRCRERLAEYLERWAPERCGDVRAMLSLLAMELLTEFPVEQEEARKMPSPA